MNGSGEQAGSEKRRGAIQPGVAEARLQITADFAARLGYQWTKPTAHTDQHAYLEALTAACPLIQIHEGHYLTHNVRMPSAAPPHARVEVIKREEKGSDVNLAVHLLHDAFTAGNKAALLVTNDSDLAEAVTLTSARGIQVFWYPPLRQGRYPSHKLKTTPCIQRGIRPGIFAASQLPDPVAGPAGPIYKPTGW